MARLEETKRKKNAIHPQSRFGRLSQRWSSGDFWWHRCGRAAVLRFATLGPDTLVPVGELIYNAHLGNTKRLLSSSRFNVFSLRDESRLLLLFSRYFVVARPIPPFCWLTFFPLLPGIRVSFTSPGLFSHDSTDIIREILENSFIHRFVIVFRTCRCVLRTFILRVII